MLIFLTEKKSFKYKNACFKKFAVVFFFGRFFVVGFFVFGFFFYSTSELLKKYVYFYDPSAGYP